MSVSRTVAAQLERSSWIRRMFEEGVRMRRERGAENVFDFTLGNPEVEPPEAVLAALRRVAAGGRPRSHGYMPNAGYPEVRAAMASRLAASSGRPFTEANVLMTVGAAGAINTVLKAMLDPGDEVIVLSPYFPEYRFYVENHGGRVVPVETGGDFQPDVGRIAAALTPRTRAILLNSPNNPTGVIYPEAVLRKLNGIAKEPVVVISDEPYKSLVYDGVKPPDVAQCIDRSVIAWSWSKAMALAGERIGYLAISPCMAEAADLFGACAFTQRVLGYVNAPAIWQWVVLEAADATVDVALYQEKRDLFCNALTRMGYDAPRPQGAFYVFPKSPIADEVAFVGFLKEEGILAVPGSGFGRGGYVRLSLTVRRDEIERSLPGFERARQKALAG